MYTECPICRTIYRLHAKLLQAQGVAACARCGNVFDTLLSLREDPYIVPPTPELRAHQRIARGDRVTVQHRTRLAQPWAPPPAPAAGTDGEAPATPGEGAAASRAPAAAMPPRGNVLAHIFRRLGGLALRNLLRHRKRTAFALSAIGFGVVAILLAGGFIEWIFWAMRESTIQSRLGHIQVVRAGYLEEGAADTFGYLLPEGSRELEIIEAAPHVEVVSPRLSFSGLVSHGETTVSFIGEGVVPEKEERLSQELHIRSGEGLSSEAPNGLILGAGLAENLGVQVGDPVVLLTGTASGGINAIEGQVRGIFFTSVKAFDDSALRLNIDVARQLIRAEGAHRWVVLLDATERTGAVLEHLRTRLADATELTLVPWTELADFYNKTVTLFSRQMNIVRLGIGLIIVFGIGNTLIMSVMDRTGEIGTLMAIGLRRRKVLRLFMTEGLLLGIIGGALGIVIGSGLAWIISTIGIPMPPPPGMDVGFTGEILVTWPLATSGIVLAVVATAAASVYPAWKASRLEIVDALRHNR